MFLLHLATGLLVVFFDKICCTNFIHTLMLSVSFAWFNGSFTFAQLLLACYPIGLIFVLVLVLQV